jgi:hypothetical protein
MPGPPPMMVMDLDQPAARSYRWRFFSSQALLCVLWIAGFSDSAHVEHKTKCASVDSIEAWQFAGLILEFSEQEGFFRSDNFVSNETSYLHVTDTLQEIADPGGAYIGVGPEQNFSYIAKLKPKIAFIVDIRRQALIQHLMFKALFHMSLTRTQFLSHLFSMPIEGQAVPGVNATALELVDYFSHAHTNLLAYYKNLAMIRRLIEGSFRFPLSDRDSSILDYVYTAFRNENLNIRYRPMIAGWGGYSWGGFATLKDLILEEDLQGRMGNFLANREDYEFVRSMHLRNRIVPVVGDFAGTKALACIADYLKQNRYTVTAFYTSNVEQYLFNNGVFGKFVENVRKLPITNHSLFIRAYPNMRDSHPARIGGHRLTTLLQKIAVFLSDYEEGLYQDYWTLVTTHFITPGFP